MGLDSWGRDPMIYPDQTRSKKAGGKGVVWDTTSLEV